MLRWVVKVLCAGKFVKDGFGQGNWFLTASPDRGHRNLTVHNTADIRLFYAGVCRSGDPRSATVTPSNIEGFIEI